MTLRIHGRRTLETLPGQATRPTPARVRQAVFNILQGQLGGCRWLDLCAGSGAMGAEALCRDSQQVLGVEQSTAACQIIRSNWAKIAATDQQVQVIQGDVRTVVKSLIKQGILVDFIYFDPPYDGTLYQEVLPGIPPLLSPEGLLMVEHRRHQELPSILGDPPHSLYQRDQRHYGQTTVTFYHHADPPAFSQSQGLESEIIQSNIKLI